MNVLSPLRVLSDSLWAGKLRLAQWEGAKAAVDRRETRRGLTAAKNSRDNFSLRPSVVQQPETFAKNSNFANASLLRNLIFRCSFHLNEPPPWKLAQHEILIEVLVDEGSARVVVDLFPEWVGGKVHVLATQCKCYFSPGNRMLNGAWQRSEMLLNNMMPMQFTNSSGFHGFSGLQVSDNWRCTAGFHLLDKKKPTLTMPCLDFVFKNWWTLPSSQI